MRIRAYLASLIIFSLFAIIHGCGSTAEAPVLSPGEEKSIARKSLPPSTEAPRRDYHTVVRGDTLYSIAWRYALDYRQLALWNRITAPYTIYPGQKIQLLKTPGVSREPAANTMDRRGKDTRGTTVKPDTAATVSKPSSTPVSMIQWRWPTKGKLIKLNSPTLQKGVNISGTRGQAILAAAEGNVVYSGSGLLGYGKLIIIKHNDVYLSAYAHNEDILVKEGMRVSSGQKIATMGKDSEQRPLLHFEIRKEGKPVDPLKHLPKQQS